ncbi:hypothetical protein Asp14428_06080 [Actinoplanes sp. NBRC 14428]|nr:hypothetical protein Asp14428_06080 [Actinoplanes sp. NBRC 14428]
MTALLLGPVRDAEEQADRPGEGRTPVSTAPGTLLPPARESRPATPLTTPAVSTMSNSHAHREDGDDTVGVLPDCSVISTARCHCQGGGWPQHESVNLTHARRVHNPAKDQHIRAGQSASLTRGTLPPGITRTHPFEEFAGFPAPEV